MDRRVSVCILLQTVHLLRSVIWTDDDTWEPRHPETGDDTIVGLRVDWQEVELRDRVKTAGGKWNPASRCGSCATAVWWSLAWRIESPEIWTSNSESI